MIDKLAIAELEREKEIVAQLIPRLGKHKIEELRQVIDKHYTKRFAGKCRFPKYGSLNKGFTDEKLKAFMLAVDKPKYKLLFGFQAYDGLRIGEACRVNVSDINFQTREIKIQTEKAKKLDQLIIPLHLFQQAEEYVKANREQIDKAQGYLFYQDKKYCKRVCPYIETDYARHVFRQYVVAAGIDESYATSEESDPNRRKRTLHLLTTHSLRHYAITSFYKQTKDWMLTSRFARHIEPNTTTTYIHTDRSELYAQIEKAFSIGERV
jgi:integrase